MQPLPSEFRRSRNEAMFGGVCAGLARYYRSTPNIMRLVFIATFFGLSGVSLPVYIVLWAVIPADQPRQDKKNRWFLWLIWSFGLCLSALVITGVLAAELPFELSIGTALITIGGLLLSTPKPRPQADVPSYAPGAVITKEQTAVLPPVEDTIWPTQTPTTEPYPQPRTEL